MKIILFAYSSTEKKENIKNWELKRWQILLSFVIDFLVYQSTKGSMRN